MCREQPPKADKEREADTINLTEDVDVLRIAGDDTSHTRVSVVREIPLTIYLNNREIVTLLCTGAHAENLAVGFLYSEGLLPRRSSLKRVLVDEKRHAAHVFTSENTELPKRFFGKRTITSGCGKGTLFYDVLDSLQSQPLENRVTIAVDQIRQLVARLQGKSQLYRRSRGVHNCALANTEHILIFRSDIGRHNAVDMILGECFLHHVSTEDKILLTTGRITSEILIKTAKMHIPLLISRSAATNLALEVARTLNMTVIGYVRGSKMLVYTGAENVIR
ncbi:MAG: formate dehydrogenase accessory sulfurtransferase FdhD [Syntrophobacteria bacterium]